MQSIQWYEIIRIGNIVCTYFHKKKSSQTIFIRKVHKIFLLRKTNNSMKCNLVKAVNFLSKYQKVFIFLCTLEEMEMLRSAIKKRGSFYFRSYSNWFLWMKKVFILFRYTFIYLNKNIFICKYVGLPVTYLWLKWLPNTKAIISKPIISNVDTLSNINMGVAELSVPMQIIH